ncbi:MAG: SDR family NAD(P)-dependent oxidoreductase [Candidatus Aenigmatarchaeota archaeon]
MDWKSSNVLITGATGFVGTWLAKALIERGANVVAFVRDEIPNAPIRTMDIFEKLVAMAPGDITDYASVKRVFAEYDIDTVFHLAAQTLVGVAKESPTTTFDVNIRGTWNVLEAARTSGKVKRMVVASTDKVYGEPIKLPITEDHPLLAVYPYDASKVAVEALTRTYAITYGLPVAITRCCNIYGGGDMNFSRIIPGTIKSVLENTNPVIRSDGTPVRDFIHVDDAVAAYITLAEQMWNDGVTGESFNFGSNAPINVLDLTNKIIEVSGRTQLKPDVQGTRKPDAEIDKQYLSAEKAARVLGWKPVVKLEPGLKDTIAWYEDYFKKIGATAE